MKAITVRQPWAWAIMHGGKDVENRTRNIAGSYRGPLVIHAGLVHDFDADIWKLAAPGRHWHYRRSQWAYGAAIGVVDLVEVHDECGCPGLSCSPWASLPGEAVHLMLANPRPFLKPIPYRGRLGLWEFPDDLLPEVSS